MNRQEELIQDAEAFVKSYIERELDARGEKMVYPVIRIKLDHTPEGEWDGINNAVLASLDEKTGNVHLYIMTCIMHKEAVEHLFGIKIEDYVGHILIDTNEKDEKYFSIVKEEFNLDNLRKVKENLKEEKKNKFPRWNTI
jgi:hypothetical protein